MTTSARNAVVRTAAAAVGIASLAIDGLRTAAALAARAGSGTLKLAGVATNDEARTLIRRVEDLSRAVRRHEERLRTGRAG